MSINFDDINQKLLARANSLIPSLLPGGKKIGREYVCAGVNGGDGGSFSINMETGIWADFATGDKGGDIISLYAIQRGLNQTDAAKELADQVGAPVINVPVFKDRANAKYAGTWLYRDKSGVPVAAVARYEEPNGKKIFSQCHVVNGSWVYKSHPGPRPLYNLDKIWADKKPILIVEGEKTAAAATIMAGNVYTVTTWLGGSNSVLDKTDWSPITGRDVLIIPDADAAGRDVMDKIVKILSPHCKIKVCKTDDMPKGWDLADQPTWKWSEFVGWAKPRAVAVNATLPAVIPIETPAELLPKPTKTEPQNADLSEVDDACPASIKEMWLDMGVPMAGNKPIVNIIAALRVITYEKTLRDNIWYDEFYRRIFINGEELADHHEIALTAVLQSRYGISGMKEQVVRSAIICHARNNTRNEPKSWLTGLKWDGKPRVRSFFADYMGTPNDEYHQDVSKYFLVSIAGRIMTPGMKADCSVVLTGKQGIKKSTALAAVVRQKWFAVSSNPLGSIRFTSSIQGKLLMELGELSSYDKAHINDVKMATANQVDRYRTPYDKHDQDLPRICMFSCTTNDDMFLIDPTGNRRFYPICPVQCDPERIEADRDQLFAEALAIYRADPINWWTVTDEAANIQEHHRIVDPWEDALAEADSFTFRQLGLDPYSGFTTNQIMEKFFKIAIKDSAPKDKNRIVRALKKLGYSSASTTRTENGERSKMRLWTIDRCSQHVTAAAGQVTDAR